MGFSDNFKVLILFSKLPVLVMEPRALHKLGEGPTLRLHSVRSAGLFCMPLRPGELLSSLVIKSSFLLRSAVYAACLALLLSCFLALSTA